MRPPTAEGEWSDGGGPVLAPLDGSPLAERALPWAIQFAARRRAPLLLARVVSPWIDPVAPDITGLRVEDMVVEADHAAAVRYLEDQAAALRETAPGLDVHTSVQLGRATSVLLQLESERAVQLVVMSTHGRSGLERWARGSVAEQMLRQGTAPVLLIRPYDEPAGAAALGRADVRVLLPLDGSDLAQAAVPYAWRVAAPAGKIALVAVIHPDGDRPGAPGHYPQLDSVVARAVRRRAAQDHLDRVAALLRRRGLHADGTVLTARDVAGAIVDHAAVKETDLIIMSTHGRGGLGRWLYGSVADAVARAARSPVLLVRPQPVAAEGARASTGTARQERAAEPPRHPTAPTPSLAAPAPAAAGPGGGTS